MTAYGYARVSSEGQCLDAQREALAAEAEFERLPEGCHQESGPTGIACRRFTKIGTTRRLVEAR
jgi:DNA invertase Pin-like site-specific DNA recombinase